MGFLYNLDAMTPAELAFLSSEPAWDNKLIDTKELRSLTLSDPTTWSTSASSQFMSLGALTRMPLEVVHMTLESINLPSLFELRCTNSHFKYLIEQWLPFSEIMTYGQNTLRALFATGAAYLWTALQLCSVLFTTRCELCDEHGEILQLLKLKRCCFRCLATDRRLLAVDWSLVKGSSSMNVSANDRDKIPHLLTIKQQRFWGQPEQQRRFLFDYTTALQYSTNEGPLKQSKQLDKTSSLLAKRFASASKTTPELHSLNRIVDVVPPEAHKLRFLAAVYMPAIKRTERPAVNVIKPSMQTRPIVGAKSRVVCVKARHCNGCRYFWNYISPHHYSTHTLYTTNELDTHLRRECFYAPLWWNKLYPRDRPVDQLRAIHLLANYQKNECSFPRHLNDDVELWKSNRDFEKMPLEMLNQFQKNGNAHSQLYGNWPREQWHEDPEYTQGDSGNIKMITAWNGAEFQPCEKRQIAPHTDSRKAFQGLYKHNASTFTMEDIPFTTGAAPTQNFALTTTPQGKDWYGDNFIGPDAGSQAYWATCHRQSTIALFPKYECAMYERKRRVLARATDPTCRRWAERMPWGFDRL